MNTTLRTVTATAVLVAAIALAGAAPAQAGGTISDVTLSTLSGPPGTAIIIESTCVFEGHPVPQVRAFLQDAGEGGAAEAPSGPSGLSRYQLVVPIDTAPGDKLLRVHCAQTEEFTFTVTDEPPVTSPPPLLAFSIGPTSGPPDTEVVVSIDCRDVDGAPATRAEVEFRTFEAPPLVVETALDAAGTARPVIVVPDVRRPFSHEIAVNCYSGNVGVATGFTSFEVTEPAPTTTTTSQPRPATTSPRFTG
ncbi:hypothetical protein [Rhabdothermincola sediminis]|uniref:hypothetical protein n=1 Tax=Rhabdothermincola sediminis TaxID=2751370 RepID=UPI001AA07D1B|nr:hypothetical protein [Rhabdothermincola sediminis]